MLSQKKSFVTFLTAGDPDLATTEKLVLELVKAGVDLVELGIPFSDPMADGPVIQRASERALKNGVTASKVLQLVSRLRHKIQVPLVLMGYYNPILQYGLKKFARDAAKAGVNGILVVDLPVEESAPFKKELSAHHIDLIFLVTPTSTTGRLQLVQKHGSGFVYYVSLAGVTGAAHIDVDNVKKNLARIRKIITHPILIGFGISKPEHVKKLMPVADGVIVGSALIAEMEKEANSVGKMRTAKRFVTNLLLEKYFTTEKCKPKSCSPFACPCEGDDPAISTTKNI